jgi:membrane protein implicated in regulation of membrane protease activity
MNTRAVIAIVVGGLVFLAVVIPVAWIINNKDWGVAMIFPAPFIVYALMVVARRLDDWVRRDSGRRRADHPRS